MTAASKCCPSAAMMMMMRELANFATQVEESAIFSEVEELIVGEIKI